VERDAPRAHAARALGASRSTVYALLKEART